MSESAKRVFVSHDPQDLQTGPWVDGFVNQLRADGVNVVAYEAIPGVEQTSAIETLVREAAVIVLVCTPAYCERFDRRVGAVGYAAELIAGRLIASSASRPSVVPVLRSGDERSIPSIFKGREIVRMTGKEVSLLEYEALLDTVLGLSRSNNRGPEVRQSPFRISHRRDAISAENIQGLVEAANRYPPPRQPDQNARLADGRWVLRSEVGRGGIARVWRSWDDTLRADVAIKMLLSQSAQDRSRVARFFRGARVMKELEGANVVGVIDQGRIENGLGYYVMEFCIRSANRVVDEIASPS